MSNFVLNESESYKAVLKVGKIARSPDQLTFEISTQLKHARNPLECHTAYRTIVDKQTLRDIAANILLEVQ